VAVPIVVGTAIAVEWGYFLMRPYLRVALVYAVFGVLWVFFSDQLAGILADNASGMTQLQTMKGWVFVALSSVLVLTITRQAYKDQERIEREKLAIFKKTIEGSYHILLNYLNQMQVVTMEAEQCGSFDREVLRQAHAATKEAEAALKKLAEVQTITAEHIDAVIYASIRSARRNKG
jgi:hypothetical protein